MTYVYDIYESIRNTPKWDEDTEKLMKSYDKTLMKIKKQHPEIYEDIKEEIYIDINGYHFNQHMLNKVYKHMINDNGTTAPHWSLDESTSVANANGISFDIFNEYDWNYVMNMMYSDYCNVFGDNLPYYIDMSKKFLYDKDAPDGKALRYYFAMCK